MSLVNLGREAGETELAYIKRLGEAKDAGLLDMTWSDLAAVFNKNLREQGHGYTESAYRKKYANLRQFKNELGLTTKNSDEAEELRKLRIELEKEKVKVRDERNEYRRLIREEARKESYKEQFISAIKNTAKEYSLGFRERPTAYNDGDCDLIVPLYDVHAGLVSHNAWNDYDGDILASRMNNYLNEVLKIGERHYSENVYVVCSEMLSGWIHQTLRIENNQDLIEQFLMVVDYVADFLIELSYRFKNVNVYIAPGNHSRITQKKDDGLAHENMDNLVIPFLSAKLQNYKNINCFENTVEQSTAMFNVRGYTVAAVHGDKDTPQNVVDNLRNMYQKNFDIVILGHKHTNALLTNCDVKVVQTGCMSGTDSFAVDIRKHNKPEQAVLIVSEQSGLECIYDVKL